ncbi:hypothetical protein C7974DRAFT_421492 [Boeremia exigua]|uniref:uncharacterized protein n=1 Tax=Boeremia exigua TaxID=749465 RepID=UPI001E8DE37A|nr:uncharacterized protein C7974DRAFT_421492 [Boeremia exigua]KAH6638827.1 hypothetical protein C7974DRAFT_421492 [Boeremia exigua]
MKLFTSFVLCGLALCFATFASAAPAPPTDNVEPIVGALTDHTSNITSSSNDVSTLGYDPSYDYHGWATVEIWTGGSQRRPVNYGDTRGANLSDAIFNQLNKVCPPSLRNSGAGICPGSPYHPHGWRYFATNALIKGDPWWQVEPRTAWVRVENGQFANEGIRTVMLQLAADTLRAYTLESNGYNCYGVPGRYTGVYCNVPQLVRINLPVGRVGDWVIQNYLHIETWGTDYDHQFGFTVGELKPCKTRKLVDQVMDKYQGDLVGLFPEWKNSFKREAKVIINGFDSCTNEP